MIKGTAASLAALSRNSVTRLSSSSLFDHNSRMTDQGVYVGDTALLEQPTNAEAEIHIQISRMPAGICRAFYLFLQIFEFVRTK